MASRLEALELLAASTGESLVTWEHRARVMTKASGDYCTALGRGSRGEQVSAKWLVSTFLAGVTADPRNAIKDVPAIGDLILSSARVEVRETTKDGNALSSFSPTKTTVLDRPVFLTSLGKQTFFEDLVARVDYLASNWNDKEHNTLHNGYRAEISFDETPFVAMSILIQHDKNTQSWERRFFILSEGQSAQREASLTTPIRRTAIISGRHLTMLAALWANSLKHTAPGEPKPRTSTAVDQRTNKSRPARRTTRRNPKLSHCNEDAALAGATSHRNQDHNSIPEADTPEIRREKENSQALSSHGPGPVRTNVRIRLHERREQPYLVGFAA